MEVIPNIKQQISNLTPSSINVSFSNNYQDYCVTFVSFSVRPTSPKSRKKLNSAYSPLPTSAEPDRRRGKQRSEPYSDSEDRRSAPSSVTTTPVATRRTPAKAKDVS